MTIPLYPNQVKGKSFEVWTAKLIEPYVTEVRLTPHKEHHDIEFDYESRTYHIECKCYYIFHKKYVRRKMEDRPTKFGAVSIQRTQLRGLKASQKDWEEIFFCIGVQLGEHDLYPVMIPFKDMLDYARVRKGKHYATYQMSWILRQKALREWMEDIFWINQMEVTYPTFILRDDDELVGLEGEPDE